MQTINERLAEEYARFRDLSLPQQRRLRKKASDFIAQHPACAHHDGFWRSLSASHVIAASYTEQVSSN